MAVQAVIVLALLVVIAVGVVVRDIQLG
jgi:hypothetical protein